MYGTTVKVIKESMTKKMLIFILVLIAFLTFLMVLLLLIFVPGIREWAKKKLIGTIKSFLFNGLV